MPRMVDDGWSIRCGAGAATSAAGRWTGCPSSLKTEGIWVLSSYTANLHNSTLGGARNALCPDASIGSN
jgi:hypothetical protein